MNRAQLSKLVPIPTAQEIAESHVYAAQRAQTAAELAAERAAYEARMRGRQLWVEGHDGKSLYVVIKRGNMRRMYMVELPWYRCEPPARTARFLRLAAQHGVKPDDIKGFSL